MSLIINRLIRLKYYSIVFSAQPRVFYFAFFREKGGQPIRIGIETTNLYKTVVIVQWTEEVRDVRPSVAMRFWLRGRILMKPNRLGWKPTFIKLLVLTAHHHNFICLGLK